MSDIVASCRHPKERFRGGLTLAVGGLIWLLLALFIVSSVVTGKIAAITPVLVYGLAFYLLSLLTAALARARAFGHNVLLGERQLPELYRMVVEGAAELGMARVPDAFLSNSNGVFNAFARRLLGGRYIFLTGALVEAETDAQVRFIIGHELGHHAAGHLDWGKNLLRLPSRFVPLLYPAYSRSRELTCDRIGARLCGDVQVSRTALQMLAGGSGRLNQRMNAAEFERQEARVPGFAGFLLKFVASHPHTCLRVRELQSIELRLPEFVPA